MQTLKRSFLLLFVLLFLSSHDMYLKLDSYFLKTNAAASIRLFNGTFEKSDNVIDRDRMIDVSLVGNGNRNKVYKSLWTENNGETILNFKTGDVGTWVAGVSTRSRNIEMEAVKFNEYLEHDGVLDMLKWREENNALEQDAVEKYSKHVKTIFQVGDKLTDDWKVNLGYPIEFIPLSNPYDMHTGHDMQFQLLFQGEPLADQLVYVGVKEGGHNHSHDHNHEEGHSHEHSDEHTHEDGEEGHHHHELSSYRTDSDGKFTLNISNQGVWYLRTIHLKESTEEGLTHESNWATLTFEIGEGHSHTHDDEHAHHHHEHETGLPSYAYWIASFVLILGLFLWFNRKKDE